MSGIQLYSYLSDPCRVSSIPYWKTLSMKMPEHLRVVHHDDLPVLGANESESLFFRLKHDLKQIPDFSLPEEFAFNEFSKDNENHLNDAAEIISSSYENISVTPAQVRSWLETGVYCEKLWIFIEDKRYGRNIALGIADLDMKIGEGILEWIQVLPEYRGLGLAKALVCSLLSRIQPRAAFATVSGECKNRTKPEILYRRCGFTGDDIWHVISVEKGTDSR